MSETCPPVEKWRFNADDYQQESFDSQSQVLILHDISKSQEPLEVWQEKNRPSVVTRQQGVGYIGIIHTKVDVESFNPVGLIRDWEEIKEDTVTWDQILNLAQTHNVKTGKWIFFVPTGLKADLMWKRVVRNFAEGDLGTHAFHAKISTLDDDEPNYKHVIEVLNKDMTDETAIFSLEEALRKAGVRCQMMYKPTINSHLGIYRRNDYGILPSLYKSEWDCAECKSKITRTECKYSDEYNKKG